MSDPPRRASSSFMAVSAAREQSVVRSPPRVLVAEDDDEMRRLVVEALAKDGYEVEEARDGGRLLVRAAGRYADRAKLGELDLIVSDIRMPICSGLQILQSLRESHWRIPVILMTAFGDDATRARAEKLGAILFDKPFDMDDLRTAVRALVPIA
jgi:DNA-binding response OmpR family regulator